MEGLDKFKEAFEAYSDNYWMCRKETITLSVFLKQIVVIYEGIICLCSSFKELITCVAMAIIPLRV